MADRGDLPLETTVRDAFTTTAAATGAPTTLSGSPAVSVYENNGTIEITAGITLTVDADGRIGFNTLDIVASAANGYEVGKFYTAVITAGTVGGTSAVGYVVSTFSIEAGAALRPTVAGRTLDVASTGEAGLDLANVNAPAGAVPALGLLAAGTLTGAHSTVTADLGANAPSYDISGATLLIAGRPPRMVDSYNTGTGVATFSPAMGAAPVDTLAWALLASAPASTAVLPGVDVTNWKGAVAPAMSGDAFARLGAPAGASMSADVAAVKTETAGALTRLPAALVGGRMDASVGAVVDGVLTAAKFAAGAFDAVWSVAARLLTAGTNIVLAKGTGVTGFNDPTAAANATAVRAELTVELARVDVGVSSRASAADMLTVLGYIDTEVNAILTLVQALPTANAIATAVRSNLDSTALAEIAAVPAANAAPLVKLNWLFQLARFALEQTATEQRVKTAAGATLAVAPVADAAGTLTRSAFAAP